MGVPFFDAGDLCFWVDVDEDGHVVVAAESGALAVGAFDDSEGGFGDLFYAVEVHDGAVEDAVGEGFFV